MSSAKARKIALGSDHAGRELRRAIGEHLLKLGHEVQDVGCEGSAAVDYPDYAQKVCALVKDNSCETGILVCGTGLGVSMAANSIVGIRAALCTNEFTARMARSHNDANILCLGERVIGMGVAHSVLEAFLNTAFAGGRHQARLEKLHRLHELA